MIINLYKDKILVDKILKSINFRLYPLNEKSAINRFIKSFPVTVPIKQPRRYLGQVIMKLDKELNHNFNKMQQIIKEEFKIDYTSVLNPLELMNIYSHSIPVICKSGYYVEFNVYFINLMNSIKLIYFTRDIVEKYKVKKLINSEKEYISIKYYLDDKTPTSTKSILDIIESNSVFYYNPATNVKNLNEDAEAFTLNVLSERKLALLPRSKFNKFYI